MIIPDMKFKKFNKQITMTINIKITKEFYFRLWLAKFLFKLGAKILGCGIKIEEGEIK